MNNSALIDEKNAHVLKQPNIKSGSASSNSQHLIRTDIDAVNQKNQAALLKNKLVILKKDHEELYKQFAMTHTESEAAKIKLAVYEKALKQILSTHDFEKVMQIAETKSSQQREHTIAMHKWSDFF